MLLHGDFGFIGCCQFGEDLLHDCEHFLDFGLEDIADEDVDEVHFKLWVLAKECTKAEAGGVEGINEFAEIFEAAAIAGIPLAEATD